VRRRAWVWGRVVASGVTLGVLVWRLGASPFLHGVRTVDARAVVAAAVLAVPTTVCCAWRWKIVARALGVDLPLRAAVAAYYRSLFLNVTLPGGVVGDVHRGISHGREVSSVGRALRAVAWERFAGQIVQGLLTVAVLLALPSPVHSFMPLAALAVAVVAVLVLLVGRARPGAERSGWGRARGAVRGDVRRILGRRSSVGIALASALVVCGHAATFLIAARTAGVTAPLSRLLPLTLVVLAVMVVPSVGGWGPREGAAAWAFGAAGLGAGQGVATAVVYGVMVLVACLPGAAVLVLSWSRRRRSPERTEPRRSQRRQERPLAEGVAHA
jgi:glycosyltransferase 2 family protein